MKNARDPKLISRAHPNSVAGFSTGQIGRFCYATRGNTAAALTTGSRARWFRVEPLERPLGFALAGVDSNDITERAFRVALRDDELTQTDSAPIRNSEVP
jgi:hypothetical protein